MTRVARDSCTEEEEEWDIVSRRVKARLQFEGGLVEAVTDNEPLKMHTAFSLFIF